MFLRWLYKSWKYFWRFVISVILITTAAVVFTIGVLQFNPVQNYLANRIEQEVGQRVQAELSIGDIRGFLPFSMNLEDVYLTRGDTASVDTLVSVDNVNSQFDVWNLLQNKISITGFSLEDPKIWLRTGEDGRITFLKPEYKKKRRDSTSQKSWFSTVEIIAPTVEIRQGTLFLETNDLQRKLVQLPQQLQFTDINAEFFVDWSDQQQYLDIESFSTYAQDLPFRDITFSGQVYSDVRFLELNSFYLSLGNSRFILNGEVDGANLFGPDFVNQFAAADYDVDVEATTFYTDEFKEIFPFLPNLKSPLKLRVTADGNSDLMQVNQASIGTGKSIVDFNGTFSGLRRSDLFEYALYIDQFNLNKEDLKQLTDSLDESQYDALDLVTASGKVNGTADSIGVNLGLTGPLGELRIAGNTQLKAPHNYKGRAEGENIDFSMLSNGIVDTTSLNFSAELEGQGFSLEKAISKADISFLNSRVGNEYFEQLDIISSLDHGLWKQEYSYRNGKSKLDGLGWVQLIQKRPQISLQGNAEKMNFARVLGSGVDSTALDFDYNVAIRGLTPDNIEGRANLDVKPSEINGDEIQAHQLYMDLNSPEAVTRSFRLTSSLFDLELSGNISPNNLYKQVGLWSDYLKQRFESEITMSSPIDTSLSIETPSEKVTLEGNFNAKNLGLLKKYIPSFPTIHTDSEISFNANTDGTRMLISADFQADTLRYNSYALGKGESQLTLSVRNDRLLKEFSIVDWETNIESLATPVLEMKALGMDLSVERDSVSFTQQVGKFSDEAQFDLDIKSRLGDFAHTITVENFLLGNNQYAWSQETNSVLKYRRDGAIEVEGLSIRNQNELIEIKGALSDKKDDSLIYNIENVNLDRISGLINGRIDFSGTLNGNFLTRSLTNQPTVQGGINVDRFTLNDRLVGDVNFRSTYNPSKDWFDTEINILTDPNKYQEYLETNDGIGQNIRLTGHLLPPKDGGTRDYLYYFGADFRQIDTWVVPLIIDNVLAEMEGAATGRGHVTGDLKDIDFHADLHTENAFVKPQFLNTNYFASGDVILDRHEGVTLDSLDVMDTKGGTGVIWGNVDLNDFEPITYLDLKMDLNELQFLNNTMDPEVPFFGNVSGTGLVLLSGSSDDMYLRTPTPMQVTSDSEVSIPLLEETELTEDGQFIRFVDSFEDELAKSRAKNGEDEAEEDAITEEELEVLLEDMSFIERFDLDLQFESMDEVTVYLIFDPVTGDILRSEGSGQVRITIQDQDIQMFGRYGITEGTYQFVLGEIISRRLDLEPGGTIVWEGDPENARLDISAIYNARPNISTLTSETSLDDQSQNGQQVPVDLIVEINGTLNSVENDYYFQLPSSLELSSNSTLSYTIGQINRDEEQKLLQATSILFTGQFIPTQGAGGATTLGQSLSRGSTVLNPILSNQVINPLLSNQINALLNSDVSRLDVDFNLNAYNEVNLGIALRLYNDRLILRREGQITGGGAQSTFEDRLGDLNATYRIRRGLSLTAFHRQNQILNNFAQTGSQTGEVTPSVDGLGLEAELQFNTWQSLFGKITGTFNSIFGNNQKEDKQDNSILKTQKAREEK